MPLRSSTLTLSVAVGALTAALSLCCMALGQAPPAPGGNPLVDGSLDGTRPPVQPAGTAPAAADYRGQLSATRQREPARDARALPLFGYSYFGPSRQIILSRLAFYRRQLAGGFDVTAAGAAGQGPLAPAPRTTASQDLRRGSLEGGPRAAGAADQSRGGLDTGPAPSPDDLAAVAGLSDARKQDLLARARTGTLTDDERRKYRALLAPPPGTGQAPGEMVGPTDTQLARPAEPAAPPTMEEVQAISALTDAQKLDILARQRTGQLTDEERRKYRLLVEPASPAGQETPGLARPADVVPPVDAFRQVADPITQLYTNVAASAPTNYQLAGGDTLTLRYWSPTLETQEAALVADGTGAITLPEAGRLVVRGQTLAQAEAAIRERLRRVYRNVQVSLALKDLRTMPVTVSGESFAPGTYTVPAVASVLNMIYATGGPTDDGSLRRIEVRRRGQLVSLVDYYRFLISGEQAPDLPLEPGDVIYIPGRMSRVTVTGEVRRPAIYELSDGESLKDALRYAGGLKPSGVAQRVQVTTLQPGTARMLKDVDAANLDKAAAVPVYDGDMVDVFSLRATLVNKVTIDGAVDQPGEYALTPSMTVADLIERARGLLSDAYPAQAHLYRYNPDDTLTLIPLNVEKALARDPAANVALARWDRLTIFTQQQVAWQGRRDVTVRGAVARPGVYDRAESMRVKDLLLMAGGTLPEANAEQAVLEHQHPDGTYAYEFVDLRRALAGDPQANAALADRDILAVYRYDEARFTPEHVVTVHGEIMTPGPYRRGEAMRLSDLLRIAGGLTPHAAGRIAVAHARAPLAAEPQVVTMAPGAALPSPDPLLQDGDVVTIQGRGDLRDRPAVVVVKGSVNNPGPILLRDQSMRLSEVIKEAGGLKPEAYPEGVAFAREPALLATAGQKQMAAVVTRLNNLLSDSEYQRNLALSDIERIKAIGTAARAGAPTIVPGITPTTDIAVPNPASSTGASSLFRRDLVSPPRRLSDEDLEPNGNVAVDLSQALRRPGGEDDIVMVDGDVVTVPERPTTVQVIGAVIQPKSVLYRSSAPVEYYISAAGGYAPDAAKPRAIVIRLGGGLTPLSKARGFRPGDVILVPSQSLATKLSSRSNDIDSFFRSLTSSAVVVLVAKKLLGL